jgi:hypothetical protein
MARTFQTAERQEIESSVPMPTGCTWFSPTSATAIISPGTLLDAPFSLSCEGAI